MISDVVFESRKSSGWSSLYDFTDERVGAVDSVQRLASEASNMVTAAWDTIVVMTNPVIQGLIRDKRRYEMVYENMLRDDKEQAAMATIQATFAWFKDQECWKQFPNRQPKADLLELRADAEACNAELQVWQQEYSGKPTNCFTWKNKS